MLSRENFKQALAKETDIIKHLFEKIPQDAFDFRPSEGQRSVIELLRYLAVCGCASMHVILNDSDWKLWKPYTDTASTLKPEEFPAYMDKQLDEMNKMLDTIPEDQFLGKEVKHPTGEMMLLGMGLVRMPLSWLTAYRMQLFLYLKQIGIENLTTSNVWGGKDRAPKV